MKKLNPLLNFFLIPCFFLSYTIAIDNHHFYRASNLFPVYHEPRFEECWLNSFDFTIGAGSTHKSKIGCNSYETCTPLLDLCGSYDMQALGYNLPNKNITNPVDLALINLSLVPERTDFATLSYGGKFSIIEANFFFTQNFKSGMFFQLHFPVRSMKITDVAFTDLSPVDSIYPNINTPAWQNFLALYPNAFAQRFNLNICGTRSTGIGDLSMLLGWTRNYEETEILDFIDFTIRFGVLIPTGKKANINNVFSLPLGYNGHVGIPITFDIAFGSCDWFTVGAHLGAMPFAHTTNKVRVKTSGQQSGLIRLDTICAKIHGGMLWDATGYLKADHICAGLSLLVGYTYAHKQANAFKQISENTTNPIVHCFPECDLINSGWTMQTLHLLAEYDLLHECSVTPRVGFFYNHPITGKHIFKTGMVGGTAGIDFTVQF
ncbi:MAG: hypothetical protein M1114_06735 [Candidatus Dependentiae bacterium]|nr:hypothetical protein [Candidatus Dependentiae bacterium]